MAWPTLGVTFFRPPFPPLIKKGLTIFNAWGIWAKRGKPYAMHIFREVWNLCAFLMGSKRMTGHQPHQDCVIVLSVEKNSWHLRLGVRFRLLFVGFPKKKKWRSYLWIFITVTSTFCFKMGLWQNYLKIPNYNFLIRTG